MSPFARVENGGRHIAFFTDLAAIDEAAEEQKLRALVEQIPASEEAAQVADRGDLAAVLWGDEDGHLNLI